MLRLNQKKAIQCSVDNNFESGIHFHATGTGKSWIALEILLKYNEIYPNNNVMWICEQKSILIEQFNAKTLKEKGYYHIYKKFNVLNFTENKSHDWYNSVNSSKFWGKPYLLIINRAFLVSGLKYTKIRLKINFIIHDECHSIKNNSTKEFYNYTLNKFKDIKCIGFSATPYTNIAPFNKILSNYTIYDAYLDNVIVSPKIVWIQSNNIIDHNEIPILLKSHINKLVYKKIIVWCGMIENCKTLSKIWEKEYKMKIYVDTSDSDDNEYNKFYNLEKNAILFCACKHREGSDIKNLDCAIFLDKVSNRNSKTFVQCIGRVLRKDNSNHKKYGLVVDIKVNNSTTIIKRLNEYLNIDIKIPWDKITIKKTLNEKTFDIHEMNMKKEVNVKIKEKVYNFTIEDLKNKFIRDINKLKPTQEYRERLKHELKLINKKNLQNYLIQATEILEITKNIPHVTRGSCGSSLVCYLLGISHVDPIKYGIKFARFLNEHRNKMPDIDFDFPYDMREKVFEELEKLWPGKIARISNHVYYHDKSAVREAIRRCGYNKFIGKNDIDKFIKTLSNDERDFIKNETNEILETFRCYSLHCGGIVYYSDGIPQGKILKNSNSLLDQVSYNKDEISENKNFKIDILSSRALAQLRTIYELTNKKIQINFEEWIPDEDTIRILTTGNNIGLTLAESPLCRKAFLKIKPKNIYDIAVVLAIIRPAAKDAREKNIDDYSNEYIFDDDAITIISNLLNCNDDDADKYRRDICKNKIKDIKAILSKNNNSIEDLEKLKNLKKYSFCKSHAFSYAQLIWKLAYYKTHYPVEFWKSTLQHSKTSYRKWVHFYEASKYNVNFEDNIIKMDKSIYAQNRIKNIDELSPYDQMRSFGYWKIQTNEFFPDCYYKNINNNIEFRGIIASQRTLTIRKNNGKKDIKMVFFIGVENNKYIEIISNETEIYIKNYIGVFGEGVQINNLYQTIECNNLHFF